MNEEKNTPATQTEERAPGFLSLAEAAAFLGLKESYLYKLTSTRQIPFVISNFVSPNFRNVNSPFSG